MKANFGSIIITLDPWSLILISSFFVTLELHFQVTENENNSCKREKKKPKQFKQNVPDLLRNKIVFSNDHTVLL